MSHSGTAVAGRGTKEAVRALLADAAAAYAGTPDEAQLRVALEELDGPLRVAFAGRVKSGKSTLLNALVGQRLAATDATECTRIVTTYVNGPAVRAWAHLYDGAAVQVRFVREGGRASIDLGKLDPDGVARLVVETPTARLERMTLIDTPGIGSVRSEVSARTEEFLVGTGAGADAVLYLMSHLHVADVGFLRALHDEQFAGTAPVNAIGVLSRADEIGGGRDDALALAGRIASSYRSDPRVRALVQTVVPVSGLVAIAATDLQERHATALADLTMAPPSLLLSADRFLRTAVDGGPAPEVRAELLDLLGLFGVRLSLALLKEGAASDAVGLAAELRAASGLDEVRKLLLERFAARAATLKAQNALRLVETTLAGRPVAAGDTLRRRVEAVVAADHDVVELRMLTALRTGEVALDDEWRVEAERLLGAEGDAGQARLDLPADAPEAELRAAALSALRTWQRRGESPVASPGLRRVAGVVRRTCEGIIAGISPSPST